MLFPQQPPNTCLEVMLFHLREFMRPFVVLQMFCHFFRIIFRKKITGYILSKFNICMALRGQHNPSTTDIQFIIIALLALISSQFFFIYTNIISDLALTYLYYVSIFLVRQCRWHNFGPTKL